jgi:hypothetical protein
MVDVDAMLEAHVQFELQRFTSDGLAAVVSEEVAALYEWLSSVPLERLLAADRVESWIQTYLCEPELTEGAVDMGVSLVRSAHSAAAAQQATVAEVLPREIYDQFAAALIGMAELRAAITTEITTSEVYSQLIAHVLYHGIKNYLLTESVVARRVPGASSLMRMGQNALKSAAPNLEKGIDKQLTAFVNANIADSIRESRTYLDTVVDDEMLGAVADEVWQNNSRSTVADAVGLVSDDATTALADAAQTAWLHLRGTATFRDLCSRVVADFSYRHGSRPTAAVLAEAGLTPEVVTSAMVAALQPVVAVANEDGYLESRIRRRLGAFYGTIDAYERVSD